MDQRGKRPGGVQWIDAREAVVDRPRTRVQLDLWGANAKILLPPGVSVAVTGNRTWSELKVDEGRYDIRARLDDDAVAVSISLTQDEHRVFTGAVHGTLMPATRRTVLRAWLRDPFASQRVTGLIRWHGIRLWLRRLPVVPRNRPTQKGLA